MPERSGIADQQPDSRPEPTPDTAPDTAHAEKRRQEGLDRGVPHDPEDETDAKGLPTGDRLQTEIASGRPAEGDAARPPEEE